MKYKIEQFVDAFPEIRLLQGHDDCDVAIGGMTALALHGLKVRDTDELDLIVYTRSEDIREMISKWTANEFGSQLSGEMADGAKRRSYKVRREELTLDFLIEEEAYIERSLLRTNGIPIQSISIILEAKRKYGRDKDRKDFKDIIKQNYLLW